MTINLIIIIISITYIWNYSGFIYDLTKFIYRLSNPNLEYMGQPLVKPFGCSGCMITWIVFFYMITLTSLINAIGIAVLCHFVSTIINKIIGIIINLINRI